jgi:D-alanyl-D-alanine carboxypeptidase/D-alanyl-D-alanine-endopeptidase (penicillin-binding protein 4)
LCFIVDVLFFVYWYNAFSSEKLYICSLNPMYRSQYILSCFILMIQFKRFFKKHYSCFSVSFFVLFIGYGEYLPAQNDAAINRFAGNPSLKHAGIGIKVVEVTSGKTLSSYNAGLALCPASTLKVLTTATALEMFGPEYRFSTQIAYTGRLLRGGTLEGDLLIVGSGDPTLGSSCFDENGDLFLTQWSNAIKKAGIKAISGDVVAVDDLYGYEGVSNRWMWGDLGNYYAAPTYGISIFDNTCTLYFRTGAPLSTPEILYIEPEIPGLVFENHLKAASGSSDSAYIYGIPLSNERRLYGTIPAYKTSFSIKGNIPDPGMLLAQVLFHRLKTDGISVAGNPVTSGTKHPGQPLTIIHTHTGNTLQEIIRVTNFRSNNHFAEHLFHKTGWSETTPCPVHVPTQAADKIKVFWQQKKIDTGGLFQYDGSGLSNANAITASMLTDVLVYMQTQSKYADVFYHSLPLAGKEGTVQSFLQGTGMDGNARMKSGSISRVQAYAGYFQKDGKRCAFAIIVNNFTGSRSALKTQIARLLTKLAENSAPRR